MTEAAARKYGVDPAILRSQFSAESGFNPKAKSPAGAIGISQVVPKWHPTADLSTPESQIDYGAKHMGELFRKYGNYEDALSVYNSGKPWARGRNISETAAYVPKVLSGAKTVGQIKAAPDGPVARVTGQASSNITKQMLASLGPAPSLAASLVQGIQGDSSDILGATTRYLGARRGRAKQEQEIKRLGKQIGKETAGLEGTPAVPTPPGGQGIKPGQEVLSAAQAREGTPYSWGGGGPGGPSLGIGRGAQTNGFDCSGLTEYAWAKKGIAIGSTTYDQIKTGRGVAANDPSKWQVGDLLFPSTGHVQLFAGNGMVTEAPRTGGVVQTVPMRDAYYAVRRPTLKV